MHEGENVAEAQKEDIAPSTTMSSFELTVAAATATARKTAAALMAAHGASSKCTSTTPNVHCSTIASTKMGSKALQLANGATTTFVIPKNKLFGALVAVNQNDASKGNGAIVRKVKKEGMDEKDDMDAAKHKNATQWAPDPLEDPIVKRGLALALQVCASCKLFPLFSTS